MSEVRIIFHFDKKPDEGLEVLTRSGSPFEFERKVSDNEYYLRSKDDVFTRHFFVYGESDSEIMTEDALHVEVQKALGFDTKSDLSYCGSYELDTKIVAALKKIARYLCDQEVPFYMVAMDYDTGEEVLIQGRNPETDVTIFNEELKPVLAGLLE
jgi:hypothetical protein